MSDKIVGVAIIHKDVVYSLPKPNRHHNVIQLIIHKLGIKHAYCREQGFIKENGDYIDRIEGAKLALENGQTKKLIAPPNLYSEDLW